MLNVFIHKGPWVAYALKTIIILTNNEWKNVAKNIQRHITSINFNLEFVDIFG